ncbi:hypothetical protein TNIN_474501 [Trichonephila inaurata madagascariensis]|uniref:Uncharacterized protein n=1 Tax=Trichonephila inaurata madagascariensis TaxID=2747483 RepID=A0A8X6XQF8_9ARAC|nr:hypothetical protein TNIN_474501 [Trichonephila inaurata madagascariensis]
MSNTEHPTLDKNPVTKENEIPLVELDENLHEANESDPSNQKAANIMNPDKVPVAAKTEKEDKIPVTVYIENQAPDLMTQIDDNDNL